MHHSTERIAHTAMKNRSDDPSQHERTPSLYAVGMRSISVSRPCFCWVLLCSVLFICLFGFLFCVFFICFVCLLLGFFLVVFFLSSPSMKQSTNVFRVSLNKYINEYY